MKKNKIKPGEEPVQLGKAELLESTHTVHEANGDITDHVSYRRPPHMEIYGTVPALPGKMEWYGDKIRAAKQKANDAYWKNRDRKLRENSHGLNT